MRRVFAIVVLATALLSGGCSAYTGPMVPSARAPLVVASLVTSGSASESLPAVGSRPDPSEYRVIVGPGHVDWMGWEDPDERASESATQTSLDVQYDGTGRVALAAWTSGHVGEPLLVLLDGRVVY
jgi:hypothetical protein